MKKPYAFEKSYGEMVLRCSVCGFCQAVCPIYGLTKRPALNARGKMLLLQEVMRGEMDLAQDLVETLFQCTGCASCEVNCPSGVKVPEILREVRREMAGSGTCHPVFEGMNALLDRHENIYGETEPPAYRQGRKVNEKAPVVYFAGCVGAFREEENTELTLDLLDRLKVDYTLIDEVCCTGVLEEVGYAVHGAKADTLVERVRATGSGQMVTGCPYCFRTFTHKDAFGGLAALGIEVVHISQFLSGIDFDVQTDLLVTYHDPCDLGRHTGIYEAPRRTIRQIAPRFVEMEHHHAQSLCCGAGGGVRASYPAHSIGMARRRLEEAEAVGAQVLLTDCNSCVHNLANAKFRRQKLQVSTVPAFILSLLDQRHRA